MTTQELMLAEKANLEKEMKRLQAVFDGPEYKTIHSGGQRRILKQLEAMHVYYDILRNRIAEEEFY